MNCASIFISKDSGCISLKHGVLILCLAEIQRVGFLCSFLCDSLSSRSTLCLYLQGSSYTKCNAVDTVETVSVLSPTINLIETLSRLLKIYTEIPTLGS